jgi:hypothetical protein
MYQQIRWWFAVVMLFTTSHVYADFAGDYHPDRWTFKQYAGDGAVDWWEPDYLELDSGASGSASLAQADLVVRASATGRMYFRWFYQGGTMSGYRFAWLRNGAATTIVSRVEEAEGSSNFAVTAGDMVGFRVTAPKDEISSLVSISAFFAPGQEPAILSQPRSRVACWQETVTFEVAATNAGEYQWQFKGINIDDETYANIDVKAVPPADAGSYRVIVRNPLGSVTSQPVQLTIVPPAVITTQPVPAVTKCSGESATFTVMASGTNLQYQWQRDGVDLPGAQTTSYTIPAVSRLDSGVYRVVVADACRQIVSTGSTLTVLHAPVILEQPQSQTRAVGDDVILEAPASGSLPLAHQWRGNGTNVIGATNSILTLTNAQTHHTGSYFVIISNGCGIATSAPAVLTISGDLMGLRIVREPNQMLHLEVTGSTGRVYVVETSTNLASWEAITTNTVAAGVPALKEVIDGPGRFYRVRPRTQ